VVCNRTGGKTDAIDAIRIAEYAFRFRDRMHLWQPPRPVLQKLSALSTLRQRLLLVRQQLQQPVREQQGFMDASLQKQVVKSCQASLKAINHDLEDADKQIKAIIQRDDRLKELFTWLTSVPGIGPATATEVLVATNEFKSINDPKKLVPAGPAVMLALRPLNISLGVVCGAKRESANMAGYG
jgi:transposase